jgi:hypothetical protein
MLSKVVIMCTYLRVWGLRRITLTFWALSV